ncbi:unnamed protein product [Caenorhabditis brenneri]
MVSSQPSILETGTGLFGTHVTLEDINDSIREHMKIENELTLDSKMEVIGDGNGFSSCVILITCQWSTPSENLPLKIVLKIVSFDHINRLVEKAKLEGVFNISEEDQKKMREHLETSIQRNHNQEINFYEVLKCGNAERLLTPKVYFSRKFSDANRAKGFIGMEYIEGTDIRHSYENCTVEEVQPILKAIAAIQALTFSISSEEFKNIETGAWFKETMGAMMAGEGMKGIYMHTKNKDPERFAERIERLEGYGPKVLNFDKAFDLNKYVGITQDVLVHGDLWAANILWTHGNNNTYSACKILDYQLTHTGNPAEDLVRFLASTLSGADRQKHWERLLEQFYGYFLEALEEIQKEIPYTLEQLKESYRQFFPVGGLALLALFGPAVEMKVQYMEKSKAEEYQKVVMEKIECLLEDVEKFYLESI